MYEIVQLSDVIDNIVPEEPVAFDTETVGKYGEIRIAQFFQKGWDKVLIVDRPDPIDLVLMLTQLTNCIVMQYSIYDVSIIQEQSVSRYIPNDFDDTFFIS